MKSPRTKVALLLAFVLLLVGGTGVAAQDLYSERTLELASRMQCPVCSGQSVADSQVTLARQMRDVIEQMVQAGESDEAIFAYFEARYGQNIMLEPSRSGFNLTLWWLPPAVLLVGFAIVVLYLREGKRPSPQAVAIDRDDELEELASEYIRSDAGNGSA